MSGIDMFIVHPAVFDDLQGKPWDQKKWLDYIRLIIKDCSIKQLQEIEHLINKRED